MLSLVCACGRVGFELMETDGSPVVSDDIAVGSDSDSATDTLSGYGPNIGTDISPDTDPDTDIPAETETETETESDTDTTTDLEVDDPLGDSSRFSFVFNYRGDIWLGPQTNGTGAVHAAPGSGAFLPASFSFFKDSSGKNTHDNKASSPYPSIGSTGCKEGSSACGPDNENGRGIFASGKIGGQEWLVVSGARTRGDLDYIYMTRDTDGTLDFSYVDLSAVMGPQTKGISAMHVFGDRLYLGAPDTGGKRPYLVSLQNTPQGSGLDATGNLVDRTHDEACDPAIHDACTLRAELIPGIGLFSDMTMIDSITDYNGRLYVANNGGIARSTVASPLDAYNHPDHWVDVTPSSSDYNSLESITTNKVADIEPADKAVPSMAVFGGNLFFARNTASGPQLWVCTPGIEIGPAPGTSTDCDPGDWQLVAPNTTAGKGLLTQFNNSGNTHISVLEATGRYLYIGFDNGAEGIALFRTSNPNPSHTADFVGKDGCTADLHSTTCDGIGGSGLGDLTNRRIFSSAFSTVGSKDYLYLVVGDGAGPARVSLLVR